MFTDSQIVASVATLKKAAKREDIANEPVVLPVIGARRAENASGKGFRILLDVQGCPIPFTVWDRDAAEFGKALQAAPLTEKGARLVEANVTGQTSAVEMVEGIRTGGYYNLTARPASSDVLSAFGIEVQA